MTNGRDASFGYAAAMLAAVDAHPDDTTWENLVVAAARLGRAMAEFDTALTAHKTAHPYTRPQTQRGRRR